MNPLRQLYDKGQSIWLDFIRRSLLTSGELQQLIEDDGVRGMTSNPSIFQSAISGSADYDGSIRAALEKNPSIDVKSLFEYLAVEDIQSAADMLRSVFDESGGEDGYVSLEVSPRLAADTEATIAEAKRLWAAVDRPNIMIKVPATAEGVPAFEELIASGVNVNVTLMFSLQHYEDVAQAYIRGLNRCDNPAQIASVASFFVSRVDGAVDKALEADGSPEAKALMGKAAVANAKLTYRRFQEIFYGDEFTALKARGARVQRPLWASTSTKNPEYRDVLYVEELIGPDTVNTLPPATLEAFRDHGKAAVTVTEGVAAAAADIEALRDFGVDFDEVTDKLQVDGVKAFADSFEELLEALKKKRSTVLDGGPGSQRLSLAALGDAVDKRLAEWSHSEFAQRLWRKDTTLWSHTDVPELADRMGWLDLPRTMRDQVDDLENFASQIRDDGYTRAVLCGMGGSSLAPEVFQNVFGNATGYPELIVLDSTHPDAVRRVEQTIDAARTLFIVSSKSGTTTETNSFLNYFWEIVTDNVDDAGDRFIAITDPGTPLETLAKERRFRRVFSAPTDVGGRYSALSVFGMVPAAIIGADIRAIIDGAFQFAEKERACASAEDSEALALGAAMGEAQRAGRDKVTFVTTGGVSALPAWIEQLIAESTGKSGTGIVPVVDEALGEQSTYGDDRLFVAISVAGEESDFTARLAELESAGNPLACIDMATPLLVGQEFLRWEIATAAAGAVLGIQPFNQPDVQLAKDLARRRIQDPAALATADWGDGVDTFSVGDAAAHLGEWLQDAHSGDYAAVQAYVPFTDDTNDALQSLRMGARDRHRLATTLGYGPRFLHSTGQLHKGGPNTGLFLQIVDDTPHDLAIPGSEVTFGQLVRAQALGDAEALRERGRRVVRVTLGQSSIASITSLLADKTKRSA